MEKEHNRYKIERYKIEKGLRESNELYNATREQLAQLNTTQTTNKRTNSTIQQANAMP